MIIDGKDIREVIKDRLRNHIYEKGIRPELILIYVGEHPVIDKYVDLKQQFGEDVGIHVNIERFPRDITNERLKEVVTDLARTDSDGIVVQLPLPPHIYSQDILNLIPLEKDVDVLSDEGFKAFVEGRPILPPVVGSVEEICNHYDIEFHNKKVVVIGRGRLVGKPVTLWLLQKGVSVTTLEKGDDIQAHTQDADIIITGAGVPNLLTSDMIKEGVVLIDAGTSDIEGKSVGDIDLACAEKASLFAPVPGGVGPITIAKLFENVVKGVS